MKLATYLDNEGRAAVGSVDTARAEIVDLQGAHRAARGQDNPWFADMLAMIEGGDAALALARELEAGAAAAQRRPLAGTRLLSPLPRPTQVRDCNNFEQHMRDARVGMERLKARLAGKPEPKRDDITTQPAPVNFRHIVFYISNRMSVVGTDAEVEWPSYSEWMDYECEFGIFIGKPGKNIAKADAWKHIYGYSILNDFSARDQQAEEMEGRMGPTKGKSFDTGNAIGPWIVTADEVPDPRALKATVRVNGEVWGSTSSEAMIHGFDDILEYLSRHETLYPGEFIGSGTLGGGCGLEIDRWLKDGDTVELEFDRLGTLRNRILRR